MKTLRFLFSAVIIETFSIALIVAMFITGPGDTGKQSGQSEPAAPVAKWIERLNFTDQETDADRQSMVQAKLESTANKIGSLIATHFDQVAKN